MEKHYVIRDINVEAALRAANAAENDIKIRKSVVEKLAMCQVCQRLHHEQQQQLIIQHQQQHSINEVYRSMTDWWDVQANCQTIKFSTVALNKNDEKKRNKNRRRSNAAARVPVYDGLSNSAEGINDKMI